MQAIELKAKLNNLTLAGYEDGEYQWVGTANQWDAVTGELEDYFWGNVARTDDDYEARDMYLESFNLK